MRKRLDLLIKHLLSQFHSVYTMILICGDLCPAYRHTKGEFQPDSSNKRQLCIRNINCAQEFFDRKIHSLCRFAVQRCMLARNSANRCDQTVESANVYFALLSTLYFAVTWPVM